MFDCKGLLVKKIICVLNISPIILQAVAMQQYMQHHGVNPHLAQQQLTPATLQQLQLAGMLDQQFIS